MIGELAARCAPNQGKFYPRLDHIILLAAPAPVIAQRLAARTNNPYGKDPDEVARTLHLQQTIEPLLRRAAGLEIDTTAPSTRSSPPSSATYSSIVFSPVDPAIP